MNRLPTTGLVAVFLAGLAGALLALCASAASAFAAVLAPQGGDPHGRPGLPHNHPGLATSPPLPPGWNKHPPLPAHVHTLASGGMPGWQITLLVAGAVLLAATLAATTYRIRAARQRVQTLPS